MQKYYKDQKNKTTSNLNGKMNLENLMKPKVGKASKVTDGFPGLKRTEDDQQPSHNVGSIQNLMKNPLPPADIKEDNNSFEGGQKLKLKKSSSIEGDKLLNAIGGSLGKSIDKEQERLKNIIKTS